MIEALRKFNREVSALIAALRVTSSVFVAEEVILERIQQLYLTWSTNLYPQLVDLEVPPEVLLRPDNYLITLVRLSSRRSRRELYVKTLKALQTALADQVVLEVARPRPWKQVASRGLTESLIPEISDINNELIPNSLLGWIERMRSFLKLHNFERNVFLMVRYRSHLNPLVSCVRTVLEDLGLEMIVARDHRLTDDLYNPIACLLCCSYGIAVFDRPEAAQAHNPNIVYELAMMQLLKRHCLILKHRSLRTMPSDFLHRLYEHYSGKAEAADHVRDWWNKINMR